MLPGNGHGFPFSSRYAENLRAWFAIFCVNLLSTLKLIPSGGTSDKNWDEIGESSAKIDGRREFGCNINNQWRARTQQAFQTTKASANLTITYWALSAVPFWLPCNKRPIVSDNFPEPPKHRAFEKNDVCIPETKTIESENFQIVQRVAPVRLESAQKNPCRQAASIQMERGFRKDAPCANKWKCELCRDRWTRRLVQWIKPRHKHQICHWFQQKGWITVNK